MIADAPWESWIVDVSVRAGWLAFIVWAVDAAIARRAWPHVRLALWTLALAAFVIPPSWTSPWAWTTARHAPGGASPTGGANATPGDVTPLGLVWVGIAVALAIFMLVATRRQRRRLERDAAPVGQRLARIASAASRRAALPTTPRVVATPHVVSPCVVGVLRPAVLLPAQLERLLDDDACFDVLLHECLHIRRRDPLAAWLSAAVTVVFWFHPAAWFASKKLATLREFCCDAEVAMRLGDDAPRYRRTLARCALHGAAPLGALAMAARPTLFARLAALEHPDRLRVTHTRRFATIALPATLALVALPHTTEHEAAPPTIALVFSATPSAEHTSPAGALGCLTLRHAVLAAQAEQQGRTPPITSAALFASTRP